MTTKLLHITNDRYYQAFKDSAISVPLTIQMPHRHLLTLENEENIISKIKSQQLLNDYLSSKEIRELAEEIYKSKTGIIRGFDRAWFYEFKNRHKNTIQKVKANCLEELRSDLKIEEVDNYIEAIEEMLKNPPHPFLLINFDETVFGRRPDKGKMKTVYIHKDCNIKAYWQEGKDLHHISLVVSITAGCNCLPPLCLSPRKTTDPDLNDTFFWR